MHGYQKWLRRIACCGLWLGCGLLCSLQAEPRRAPVPAHMEIEILDPGVDPVGNPAVVVGEDTPYGRQIDIPPTVLVHRYYYSGNRNFQGPMLPGGPSIVVATHPESHERLYIDVNLLPGIPRVIYTPNAIEYDYGNRGVKVIFGRKGCVDVEYRNAVPLKRIVFKGAGGVFKAGARVIQRTGAVDVTRNAAVTVAGAAGTTLDGIREGGKRVMAPVVNVAQVLPVVNPVVSSLRDQGEARSRAALSQRDAEISRAQSRIDRLDGSIPTNR